MEDIPEEREQVKYCWNDKDRVCDDSCVAYFGAEWERVYCSAARGLLNYGKPLPVAKDK